MRAAACRGTLSFLRSFSMISPRPSKGGAFSCLPRTSYPGIAITCVGHRADGHPTGVTIGGKAPDLAPSGLLPRSGQPLHRQGPVSHPPTCPARKGGAFSCAGKPVACSDADQFPLLLNSPASGVRACCGGPGVQRIFSMPAIATSEKERGNPFGSPRSVRCFCWTASCEIPDPKTRRSPPQGFPQGAHPDSEPDDGLRRLKHLIERRQARGRSDFRPPDRI